MLRFYHTNLKNDSNFAINDSPLLMDGEIWKNCRSFLPGSDYKKNHDIDLIPVKNTDVHGALGEGWMEYFDYRGCKRNEQYFLVRDYTDIPTSNPIHVLHGKKVWLIGDARLCKLLTNYLNLIENGEVAVQYTELGKKITAEKEDILCLVVPDFKCFKAIERKEMLRKKLADMGFIGHTEYFVCNRCFDRSVS